MNKYNLYLISRQLMEKGKGILASDESPNSLKKKFDKLGIKSTEETRRRYREIFITTDHLEKYITGIILHDETIRQMDSRGYKFIEILKTKGIVIGIKVDEGTEPLKDGSGELISIGLGGLKDRLGEYYELGARFTKWRSVIKINPQKGYPTQECIEKNSEVLAKYALEVQKAGLVPIIEPEVLMDGDHTIQQAEEATTKTLVSVFDHLQNENVDLKAVLLKSSMVLPGSESPQICKPEEIAEATIRTLEFSVPHEIPGIVFLSGGQTPPEAAGNLDAIAKKEPLPWEIAFSYQRAIEQPSMDVWKGKDDNVKAAQEIFVQRLKMVTLADEGLYSAF